MLPQDIDPNKLWLMEEGHCFRSQIVNLCELRKATEMGTQFEYEAGSIETLRRMVEPQRWHYHPSRTYYHGYGS